MMPADAQLWIDTKFDALPILTPTPLTVPVREDIPNTPVLPLDGATGPQPGVIAPTDGDAPAEEPAPSTDDTAAELPPVLEEEWLKTRANEHEHEDSAETGLIAAAVTIWALVAIMLVAFLVMYCSEKKGRSANYTVQ